MTTPGDYGCPTEYGFRWGPAVVERIFFWKKGKRSYRVIRVQTPHREVEIYVSATGRSVRVFRDQKELS